VNASDIQQRIEQLIPGAKATVEGADQHFSALVVAGAFAGKSRIERHQMIYALFRNEMASQAIHALALRTSTPDEHQRAGARQET
jgi:acid stress-induced BolA-like protein IbaG/YrbA